MKKCSFISKRFSVRLGLSLLGILTSVALPVFGQEKSPISSQNGHLTYQANERGDRVPDFSFSGYQASEAPIPEVPVKRVVKLTDGDATALIQAALEEVGKLPKGENGFRGAVLLEPGTYQVSGQLVFRNSGVVLRGSGVGENGTEILGTGKTRETLVRVLGGSNISLGDTLHIQEDYVPVNGNTFTVDKANSLQKGDGVLVVRPSTQKWIEKLDMVDFGGETGWIGWKPEGHTLRWDREVSDVKGNEVNVDVPITTALDKEFGGGYLIPYTWTDRIEKVGVENLTLRSAYDESNPKDEAHRWMAITMENVQDAWVRQVDFKHFAGSAVAIYKTGKRITVEDCRSMAPVSEIAGERRNTFFTEGQQTLFQRCYSEFGYHDFSTGLAVPGPNAFVQCEAYLPYSFSGGQQGWASGVLFDVVRIDGHALKFANLEQEGRGAGWTAANSVFWQCDAAKIENYNPPTAQNWAFGVWAQFSGDGYWGSVNSHINPRSLFYAQLEDRLGTLPFDPFLLELGTEPSTSPTLEQARELTIAAREDLLTLHDWIRQAPDRNPISIDAKGAKVLDKTSLGTAQKNTDNFPKVKLVAGRLQWDGQLLTGKKQNVQWWRGSLRPRDLASATPHITRFVPGREGTGMTDDLNEVVQHMVKNNVLAIDHNYGLWYDRRRDDHQRVRRMDPDVWPPFYEQPFARSGKGEAWDRLSQYDLTQPNTWYWGRLKSFADLAEKEGKLLFHQNYFQHNILEAGAHWADSPWRPANNINETGFPEPAPYAGDKRIFLDEQFYDVNHPVRRELHRQFIWQCMDNFAGNSNVLQMTSAEYTGPLHFVEFWLDVAQEWEATTGKEALMALSATKDVQDAILDDPKRSDIVDVIDIRYWHPTEEGAYAPEGGKHLAPRQHARKMSSGKESPEAVYRSIWEYRERYPEKAVIYNTNAAGRMGWTVLFAGGSLPSLPEVKAKGFSESLAKMSPVKAEEGASVWLMKDGQSNQLIFAHELSSVEIDLKDIRGRHQALLIDPNSGDIKDTRSLSGGRSSSFDLPEKGNWLVWIKKR